MHNNCRDSEKELLKLALPEMGIPSSYSLLNEAKTSGPEISKQNQTTTEFTMETNCSKGILDDP